MSVVIADVSFGHADVPPDRLRQVDGLAGVIAYAGCKTTGKNCTRAELDAWLAAGLWVGLVIENNATDAARGYATGVAQGHAILAAAEALGYDVTTSVLYSGYDTNATPAVYPELIDFEGGFASVVPVPGYYGDSDSINHICAAYPDTVPWQSAAASESPQHPTPLAVLWQQAGGIDLHGLPIDANLAMSDTLFMMGETVNVTISDADKQAIAEQAALLVWQHKVDEPAEKRDWQTATLLADTNRLGDETTADLRQVLADLAAIRGKLGIGQ